jgi:predicted MFS family arabinose efflux permease
MGTVALAQSAKAGPSVSVVAAICAAEIFGLAGFSIVPALLPQFIAAWSLTNTQAGWLAGITSAGYMLAVIPLVSLTDRRPGRQLYLASSVLSALSCVGMGLCDSLLPALGFRALAGIAMAGMYMPGLRALTLGVEGATRARIAAWYTSSFTIGASLSFLFGRVGTLLGWRSAFVIAGMLGAAGVLIAWAALPHGGSGREEEPGGTLGFWRGSGASGNTSHCARRRQTSTAFSPNLPQTSLEKIPLGCVKDDKRDVIRTLRSDYGTLLENKQGPSRCSIQ